MWEAVQSPPSCSGRCILDDEEVEDDIDDEAVVEQVLCLDEDDEKWKSSGALEDVVWKEFEMDEPEVMC